MAALSAAAATMRVVAFNKQVVGANSRQRGHVSVSVATKKSVRRVSPNDVAEAARHAQRTAQGARDCSVAWASVELLAMEMTRQDDEIKARNKPKNGCSWSKSDVSVVENVVDSEDDDEFDVCGVDDICFFEY